ncbi:DNA translocase FtsK 4TM domain-containing protein, partial [Dyella sp.]|uniref:DNA translocase FtsK 4TM domain-containing protein n=1 Tax=Dyella sp. TaxID=1869338 RepID=UPI002ED3293D
MFSFLFGGFGLSTLWLIRPFWRLLRPLFRREKPAMGGQGAIRFWLGVLLVLLASATLEGALIDMATAGAPVGGVVCHALADALAGLFGHVVTALLMLVVLAVALPWYLGMGWRDALARATDMIEPLGEAVIALVQRMVARATGRKPRARRGAVRRAQAPARARPAAMPKPAVSTEEVSPSFEARASAPSDKVIDQPWRLPRSAQPTSTGAGGIQMRREPRLRAPAVSTGAIVAAAQAFTRREERVFADDAPQVAAPTPAPIRPIEILPELVPDSAPEPENEAPGEDAPFEPAPAHATTTVHTARPRSRGYAANDELEQVSSAVEPVAAPVARLVPSPRMEAGALAVPALRVRAPAHLPGLALLAASRHEQAAIDDAQLAETGELIEQRLREFKVPVTVVGASAGPVITRFEVEPAVGVRGNQIVALMKDLARGLGRTSIRVVETIPGKTCMGLELPNEQRQMIALSEILDSSEYRDSDSLLTLAMGK